MADHSIFIAGGAGFIGSHFVERFLEIAGTERVTVYDNFSSGRRWHLRASENDARLRVIEAAIEDSERLLESMRGHDLVVHLASNPDIARAVTDPDVDFRAGTVLTRNVLEAARRAGVRKVLYASGSGVYGDLGQTRIEEDHGPLEPVSTYGASKLAGEAMLSAYCHMFGLTGVAFRFANVVGARQTHGVGFDFLRKLQADPTRLQVLGDGHQRKPYVHVSDVVSAVLLAATAAERKYRCYNIGPRDTMTVREIAALAIEVSGLDPTRVALEFAGGDRGWKGDVPVVHLDTERVRALGWVCRRDSKEAMRAALQSMLDEIRSGLHASRVADAAPSARGAGG